MATYRERYFRLDADTEPVIPDGVTELRIHGVNGAPPDQLLNDPHPVIVSGDDKAAFYRTRSPVGPPARTVEAYSWTGLNSRAASRAFWLLLFPFGMANFAGWLLPEKWGRWRVRVTRALIRVLGAVFTVHYALWAMVLAVDLLAVQCTRRPACLQYAWLGWLKAISNWLDGDLSRLIVLFSAVPLLTIAVLWGLGRRSAVLYDRYWPKETSRKPTEAQVDDHRSRGPRVDELRLRDPRFWRAAHAVQVQALLHVVVTVAAVGVVLGLVLDGASIRTPESADLTWWGGWIAGAAGLGLVVTAVRDFLRRRRATPRERGLRTTFRVLRFQRPWRILLSLLVVGLVLWIGSGQDLAAIVWALAAVGVFALVALLWAGAAPFRRHDEGEDPYPGRRLVAHLLWALSGALAALVAATGWGLDVQPGAPLRELRGAFDLVLVVELGLLLVLSLIVAWRLWMATVVIGSLLWWSLDVDQVWRWNWLLVMVGVAVAFLVVYFLRARSSGSGPPDPCQHREAPFWIFVGLAVLALLAILEFRTDGVTWPCKALAVTVAIVYLVLAYAILIWRGHDQPPSWRLRGGGAAAMAAVGATALVMVSASGIINFAKQLGPTMLAEPGEVVPAAKLGGQIYFYGELGWIAAAGLAMLLVFVAAFALRVGSLWLFRWRGQIGAIHEQYDKDPKGREPDHVDETEQAALGLAKRAAWARLFGALVDDADWLLSAAVVTVLAGGIAIVLDLRDFQGFNTEDLEGLKGLVSFSSWLLGLVALGAIFLVQKARSDEGVRRSVGIIWEVTSFFPRRFHPLAPPSYAERAVPELRGRLDDLAKHGKVLLLAHSQGSLISAAALMTFLDDEAGRERLRNISLVTFGCMLRRLFGRAYPAVVRREDLAELKRTFEGRVPPDAEFPEPTPGTPARWANFGRHSDFLGGRVFAELQPPPGLDAPDRTDEIYFGDPTRRWRFRGQTQPVRFWRHSFDYLDDAEDPRFEEHVIATLKRLQAP